MTFARCFSTAMSSFCHKHDRRLWAVGTLEALSYGVPVVASRAGGLVEVVDDGKTGFLCPVGDVAAMADAVVLRILSVPNLRSALS